MHGPWFKDLIDLIACPTLHSKFAGLVVGPEISNGRQSSAIRLLFCERSSQFGFRAETRWLLKAVTCQKVQINTKSQFGLKRALFKHVLL